MELNWPQSKNEPHTHITNIQFFVVYSDVAIKTPIRIPVKLIILYLRYTYLPLQIRKQSFISLSKQKSTKLIIMYTSLQRKWFNFLPIKTIITIFYGSLEQKLIFLCKMILLLIQQMHLLNSKCTWCVLTAFNIFFNVYFCNGVIN